MTKEDIEKIDLHLYSVIEIETFSNGFFIVESIGVDNSFRRVPIKLEESSDANIYGEFWKSDGLGNRMQKLHRIVMIKHENIKKIRLLQNCEIETWMYQREMFFGFILFNYIYFM